MGTSILAAMMSPFVPFSSGATVKESILDPRLSCIWILKRFSMAAARMGLLGHLARRPLTPKYGAKAIVFSGRGNGLAWNAALAVRNGDQSIQFDPPPATSGLPRTADIIRSARLVRFVPKEETYAPQ